MSAGLGPDGAAQQEQQSQHYRHAHDHDRQQHMSLEQFGSQPSPLTSPHPPAHPPLSAHHHQHHHHHSQHSPSSLHSPSSDPSGGLFETPPAKRQRLYLASAPGPGPGPVPIPDRRRGSNVQSPVSIPASEPAPPREPGEKPALMSMSGLGAALGIAVPEQQQPAPAPPVKSRRVRTGCLTCRERHLKCDEAMPDCMNCRKSNRECKRGVRLNFIDTQVRSPPHIPAAAEWSVQFQDESRQIASEYRGGLSRYAQIDYLLEETEFRPQPVRSLGTPPSRDSSEFFGLDSLVRAGHVTSAGSYRSLPAASSHESRLPSRKSSETSLMAAAATSVAPPSSHSSGGAGSDGRRLRRRRSAPPIREEEDETEHAHRGSDLSSAASVIGQAAVPLPPLMSRHGSSKAGEPPDGRGGRKTGTGTGTGTGTPQPGDDNKAVTAGAGGGGHRDYLNSPEEVLFMRVFVEHVGVWMDSFDRDKHFSRLIPYHALRSPMLLNSFLACGVRHLTLVNDAEYRDEKALFYYDTATTQLLRSLQNPDRDMSECAVTAVVLNVYEIMSERPAQRMSHIAGARALIRECGWDGRSTGIGAACFWLNIGMEVLSCLAFGWTVAWDPDQWGVDMDFGDTAAARRPGSSEPATAAARPERASPFSSLPGGPEGFLEHYSAGGGGGGQEELWVHRIFYIVAKIANFRADDSSPAPQAAPGEASTSTSAHDEQVRLAKRLAQWQELKRLCDRWNDCCPRTMHPFGYLYASQTSAGSAFPQVWLIKRAAIVGRLFYHTAQCLLAQTNPMEPRNSAMGSGGGGSGGGGGGVGGGSGGEMAILQLHHAHQVCGIVAHTIDRGVASVAIRSLAVAAAVLVERGEQEEVLRILARIEGESGWKLQNVVAGLKRGWGWQQVRSDEQQQQQQRVPPQALQQQQQQQQQHQQHQQQQRQQHQQHQQQHVMTQSQPQPQGTSPHDVLSSSASGSRPGQAPLHNNPLAFGDFSHPNHPYQNWYEPPNRGGGFL